MSPGPHSRDPEVRAYAEMRDREEREPHRLDSWLVNKLRGEVFKTANRRELDKLTRRIWQRYGKGLSGDVNQTWLEELQRSILARREQLERSDPR